MIARSNAGRGRRTEASESPADLLRRAARFVDAVAGEHPLFPDRSEIGAPLAILLRTIAADAEAVDRGNADTAAYARRHNDDGQTYIAHRDEVAHAMALAQALLEEDPT